MRFYMAIISKTVSDLSATASSTIMRIFFIVSYVLITSLGNHSLENNKSKGN